MYQVVVYYGYNQDRKVIYRSDDIDEAVVACTAVGNLVTGGDNSSLFITDSSENMAYHVAVEVDVEKYKENN